MPGYPLRLTADELAASGAAQRPPRTDVDLPREGKEAVYTNYSVPGNCNPGTREQANDDDGFNDRHGRRPDRFGDYDGRRLARHARRPRSRSRSREPTGTRADEQYEQWRQQRECDRQQRMERRMPACLRTWDVPGLNWLANPARLTTAAPASPADAPPPLPTGQGRDEAPGALSDVYDNGDDEPRDSDEPRDEEAREEDSDDEHEDAPHEDAPARFVVVSFSYDLPGHREEGGESNAHVVGLNERLAVFGDPRSSPSS